MNTELIFKEESYKIVGACFEVYREKGCGFLEPVYQECMEFELELHSIPFDSKRELACVYKGRELKKRYIPDLFAFDGLVVELKAVTQLTADHEAQLYNYMRISRQPVGYLINFGHKDTLEWKRLILSEFIPPQSSAQISAD